MDNITKIKLPDTDFLYGKLFLSEKIINPKKHWGMLIILFIFLIITSIGFDFYMYQKIVSGDMYINVTRSELVIENLKTNDLQNILNNFESKTIKIANLKLENLVDPSI